MDINEKLYTQAELLQMIYGLMNVYWSKSKWTRWAFKPWYDALATLALQIAGNNIVDELATREAISDWENQL